MVYLGSKARLAKHLVPYLQDIIDTQGINTYIEICCGGCNLIDKIRCPVRIASDISEPLIAFWKALQEGWRPPMRLTEEEYNDVRYHSEKYPLYLVGCVGYLGSFGSAWWGGFARDGAGKRDIYNERIRNLLKQLDIMDIKSITFIHSDYRDLDIPKSSLIYVDPPYFGMKKYKDAFDHEEFYKWCHEQEAEVRISEYWMPEGFKEVLNISHNTSISRQRRGIQTIEKVYKPV